MQYEYRMEKPDLGRLNSLGRDGWQAVCAVSGKGSAFGGNLLVLMMRPVPTA